MNEKELSAKCFQMYQMAVKNMEDNCHDLADEVIVTLWRTLEKVAIEKQLLQEIIVSQQKDIAKYCHKHEVDAAVHLKNAHGNVNVLDVLKPFMKGTANEN